MAKPLTMDDSLVENVTKLRDDEGKKWSEITEATGVASGKCMLAYAYGQVPKKDRIKDATADDVIRLRDGGISWGAVSVRCLLPESTCRTLYEKQTGNSTKGNRIGKGGRYPGESTAEAKPAKAPREPRAAKVAKVAKVAEPVNALFTDVADDDVADMLTGFAIMVDLGNGEKETIKVSAVKKVAKGKAIITDGSTGASRTVKLAAISKISVKKVK